METRVIKYYKEIKEIGEKPKEITREEVLSLHLNNQLNNNKNNEQLLREFEKAENESTVIVVPNFV